MRKLSAAIIYNLFKSPFTPNERENFYMVFLIFVFAFARCEQALRDNLPNNKGLFTQSESGSEAKKIK